MYISQASLRAYAKLTVHLHITGVREDGYHLIDAEMVSLDLHDVLKFSDGNGLSITGPFADGVPMDESNIVARALRLTGRNAHIQIEKNIPHGGGLGGGSADAGAVLRWAGFDDYVAASRVGADVPFCINGGRARVRGIGDLVEPLPFEQRTYTLLLPPFGVNTAAVYKAFDEGTALNDRNHLTEAALLVEPRMHDWVKRMRDWTGEDPVLAGSGSTLFVEGFHDSPSETELAGARWVVAKTIQP